MNKNIQTLPIAAIRRDSGAQFRDKISEVHIGRIIEGIENGAAIEPIEVFFDGDVYWLADGEHRVIAHERTGRADIEAEVKDGSQMDARRRGRSANSEHNALPRSVKAKRAAVTDALTNDPEWAKWSDQAVAKGCGVSREFVRQMRNELGLTCNVASEERTYTTKHGTIATMKTGGIGGKKDAPTSPRIEEIELSKISMIYDDPQFQATYPLSALTDKGVALDDATEWHGINRAVKPNDEPDGNVPLMVWIWPEGFPGFFQVRVFWCGNEEVSESIEPEPIEMIVFRLDSLGVPIKTLSQFAWKSMPAEDFSAEVRTRLGNLSVCGRRAMQNTIESCAKVGRSFLDVREELKDNTEEGTRFEDWIEGENAMNTSMEYAEKAMTFTKRYEESEAAWERGDQGEEAGALIEAALDVFGSLGELDEDGQIRIPMFELEAA